MSLEIEPARQAESKQTLGDLGLDAAVEYVLGDAGTVLDRYEGLEFVLIDCEKEDYVRFFDQLKLAPGAIVVADKSSRTTSGTTSSTSAASPASSR